MESTSSTPTARRMPVRIVRGSAWGRFVLRVAGITVALAAGTGCATTDSARLQHQVDELREEVEAQRRAQAALRARLERLEERQRTAQALRQSAGHASHREDSIHSDVSGPPDSLPVVRLDPKPNPVTSAPPVPTHIPLRGPTEDDLARFGEPAVDLSTFTEENDPRADLAFSLALQKYNLGDRREAAIDLRRFADRYPRHSAADNALYLAGMALVSEGQCADARNDFERAGRDYPQGDVTASALLALGQCEAALGRVQPARTVLQRVIREYPKSIEADQARSALNDLPPTTIEASEYTTGSIKPVRG